MPRRARVAPGGLVYHVLNRSVAGLPLFRKEGDFEAFERIMIEAHAAAPHADPGVVCDANALAFRRLAGEDGEVTAYFRWLAHTHAMRWHVAHKRSAAGTCTRGVSSFPDPGGRALPDGLPLRRAECVDGATWSSRAEDWRWGSLWARRTATRLRAILSDWPMHVPRNWVGW